MPFHPIKYLAAACFYLALLTAAAHAQQTDRLTPMDMFNIQYAGDPQISPDGQKIVYARRFSDVMTDKSYSNLWIINFDGSDNRPLTTGNFIDASPRWSPDGTRIAFVSDREGNKPQIYIRWMDTGQTAKITNLEFAPSGIAWSPDGKSLAFLTLVPIAAPKVGTIPSPPAGAKWEPQAKVYDTLVYRFNGMGYLPHASSQLFVIPADGGTPHQLTKGDHPLGGIAGFSQAHPVWTPDGAYLILSANGKPDFEYDPFDTEVFQVSIEDGSMKALTSRHGPDNSPAVSPDGQHIAYIGLDERYQGYQVTHLYLMNRDGSGSRQLATSFDRDIQQPSWAPDGGGIYFHYDDQGDTKLGFCALDGQAGGQVKTIAEHLGGSGSSYGGAAAFTVARNGNFAITYTTPAIPGDIAAGTIGGAAPRIITSVNAGLLAQRKLGQVEDIWFTSSIDERKIEGWIIKPPDFDPSRKYPLILEIHGGPFADYGDRFDIEKQIMAAQGYVVFYANPRGSTSYGAEFGNLIHHNYPGDDFYDLNSGVDAVIDKGFVDKDSLFVTGGSGGGVLTCWMVDRTTRFRAAVSLYPVINWYSWTLTADIPIIGVKYWFPGNPWENIEQYMKRSVISYVDKVATPTMLMVGEEDYRCPPTEAEQFYEALKLRKIDTALVLVPGEPHGISRIPSHHMQKVAYVLNWFEEHKKK